MIIGGPFMRSNWLFVAAFLLPFGAAAQTCSPAIPASDLVAPGSLQMAINPTLPPQQFVDAKGELQGLNVDLMNEVAKRLCIPMAFIRMDFPPMFPALAAQRFDGIDTGMFWTEERSKIAYTVPYAQQAISITVAAGSPLKITDEAGLAGHSAGVEVNAYQERWLRGVDKDNVAKGLKPIDIRTFTTATDVIAALRAGQIETAILIDQTAKEIVRRGVIEITATGLGGAPTTLVFRNKAIAQKVAETLTAMKKDGFYDALFDRYGLTKLPVETFVIRGPGPG
jgi:polar amino acid transport system substrate-binding protein